VKCRVRTVEQFGRTMGSIYGMDELNKTEGYTTYIHISKKKTADYRRDYV
jgi:hypothetical protein